MPPPSQIAQSNTEMGALPARDVSMDVARSLLIIYIVVVIHPLYWSGIQTSELSSLLLLEMPPIFVIAGAAFAASSNRKNYFAYLLHRAQRILIPYWVYCIFAVGISVTIATLRDPPQAHDPISLIGSMWNPFARHRKLLEHPLAAHLWFVPIYLGVVATLPAVALLKGKLQSLTIQAPFWIILGTLVFLLTDWGVPEAGPLSFSRHLILYVFWASFGYSNFGRLTSLKNMPVALLFSVACIVVCHTVFDYTLNMQLNKFPPNQIFFQFGSFWVIFLLILIGATRGTLLPFIQWFAIFGKKTLIPRSFTIYLWHPVGFILSNWVIAQYWPRSSGGPQLLVIACLGISTLLLSLIFAKVFGRIESLQFPFGK